jgi:D-amino-acid dehydrogenase
VNAVYDVVVVGGGIVGFSTAYHCVREGLRTLLLDRADPGRATDAGAGILSGGTSASEDAAWLAFATAAVRYYDVLLRLLEEDRAGETGYARCGLILVAASQDEVEAFDASVAHVFQRQQRTAWPSPDDLYEISPAQAREKFPPLGHVLRALYSRAAARMDGRLFTQALRRAAEARGLIVESASVERLLITGGKVTGVVADGQSYSAAHVVVAGGAWSNAFARQLNISIPVEPQRGQIIHLQLPEARTDEWTIVTAFRGHYIVPWPGGRVVVGATRETGAGYDPRLTAAGVHEVLSEALRVAPGLATAGIAEMRVGLRPLSQDGRPLLGRVPTAEGVLVATGHGPAGLQLGPYSGKVICDLLLGRRFEADLSPFQIARFM